MLSLLLFQKIQRVFLGRPCTTATARLLPRLRRAAGSRERNRPRTGSQTAHMNSRRSCTQHGEEERKSRRGLSAGPSGHRHLNARSENGSRTQDQSDTNTMSKHMHNRRNEYPKKSNRSQIQFQLNQQTGQVVDDLRRQKNFLCRFCPVTCTHPTVPTILDKRLSCKHAQHAGIDLA